MDEYRYERINENNLDALAYLYKNVYNEDISLDSIKQKFNTESFGTRNIGYIAFDNNNIPASIYSVFPIEVTYKNRTYLAGQTGDLLTHLQHRRKGLLMKLAEKTHILARNEGINFLYGITYKDTPSLDGLIKYTEYYYKNDFNSYNFKVQSFPLLYLLNKNAILRQLYDVYFSFIMLFYNKYKSFRNYEIDDWLEIKKDEKFFNYKTYNKSFIISLNNTRVWLKIKKNSILIGDIEKMDFLNIKKLVNKLKIFAFFLGIRSIQFEISPDAKLDIEFNKYFHPENNFHLILLDFNDNLPTDKFKLVFGDFDSF